MSPRSLLIIVCALAGTFVLSSSIFVFKFVISHSLMSG